MSKQLEAGLLTAQESSRKPGVLHLDLATFEPSADGHKYCLVAAVTVEIEKESKLLPIFAPMPKKDSVSGLPAISEALTLTLCNDRNLHWIAGSRIVRIQADGGGEFNNQKLKDLCFDKNITRSLSPAHQPSSNGTAENHGWSAPDHSLWIVEAGPLRETMVVKHVQVCKTHDARKSTWETMDVSTLWPTCWHLERT